VCAALVLTSCHGSSKKPASSGAPSSAVPSTDAKGKPKVSLALSLGKRDVQAAGAPRPFDVATATKIRKLVNDYIAVGIARPLFTGATAGGLVRYFSPTLIKRAGPKGHDRAALTDENTPTMTTVTKTVKGRLNLVELQDHGRVMMIGASFVLSVRGETDQGPLAITRYADFVLEHNTHGVWYITGYHVVARRDANGSSTTQKATTTTAGK
jgi:hypothetical protein